MKLLKRIFLSYHLFRGGDQFQFWNYEHEVGGCLLRMRQNETKIFRKRTFRKLVIGEMRITTFPYKGIGGDSKCILMDHLS